MPKHGDGAGRSAYVLVLREHEEEGRGYALELAPLSASDAAPRARGRASTRVEETAAAAATATRTGTGTGPRAHGSGQTREEAAGGAPSRDQGPRSTRESATVTSTAPRARGESPAREAGTAAAGRAPRPRGCHARGLNTAVDVAAGGLHGGDGAGGGGEAADAICDDLAGAAGEQILRDMRTLLFSQPDGSLTQDSLRIDDANKNLKLREREVLIPVFLSPKKKGQNKVLSPSPPSSTLQLLLSSSPPSSRCCALPPHSPSLMSRWGESSDTRSREPRSHQRMELITGPETGLPLLVCPKCGQSRSIELHS